MYLKKYRNKQKKSVDTLKIAYKNNRIQIRIMIRIRIRIHPLVRGMDPRIRIRIRTKFLVSPTLISTLPVH